MNDEPLSFKDELWRYSIAAGSVLASIGIVALTVAAGWYLMWVTTLRKMKLVKELRGLNRRLDEKQRKELDEEIERVKMQHRRAPNRRVSPSISPQ
ncbi:hypothetical protein BSKO_00624 [Bryopsis sp. KO-2023]|nr:hypothetical protein BSKO_00624 [Bryopsis sp. KO-2023]